MQQSALKELHMYSKEEMSKLLNLTTREFSKMIRLYGIEILKMEGTTYLNPDDVVFLIERMFISKLNSQKKVQEIRDTFNDVVYSFFDEWKHELSPEFSNIADADIDRIYESAFAEYSKQLCIWLNDSKRMSFEQRISLQKILSSTVA
jgi:hypothetical protein